MKTNRTVSLPIILLFSAIGLLTGCELTTPPPPFDRFAVDDIIYTQHIQPIFDAKCTRCHEGPDAANGLRLNTWENLLAGSDDGEAIIAYDGDKSLLIGLTSRLVGGPHPFEQAADTLTTEEVNFIKRWIDGGARFDGGIIPFADATQLLYVPNENDALISVIDAETQLVIRNVDLVQDFKLSPNARPTSVAIDPDSNHWYVSLSGINRVLKLDRLNTLVGQVDIESPGLLAVHPREDLLFVSRSQTAVNPPPKIGVIERSTMTLREVDLPSSRPYALVADPRGGFVYTGSLMENRIMSINTQTDAVTFTLLSAPFHSFGQFAMSPEGTRTVLAGQLTSQLLLMDSSAPASFVRMGDIEVGAKPGHPVFSPDGQYVYIGNGGENTVSVIDVDTRTIFATIDGPGLAEPFGASISPNGRYLFIGNRNSNGTYTPRFNLGTNQGIGTVTVINTETNQIERVIEVGRAPAALSQIMF
ncbi:MAG: c-type cytochrome domain-containing protein [Rhodothermales bacterium]